jgi:hypothetical protein
MTANSPSGKPSFGRRVYLINPSFQLRFIGLMLLVAGFSIGILYASNLFFIWKFVEIGRSLALPPEHPFFRFISEQRQILHSVSLVTAALLGLLIAVSGVFLSHRIAGPIYRMQTHLERVAETRELRVLSFRKGDFFPEMAESINKALRAMGPVTGASEGPPPSSGPGAGGVS